MILPVRACDHCHSCLSAVP